MNNFTAFKRPPPKRNSPPSTVTVPSAVQKSRQESEVATVYSSPEPKRLDFAADEGSNSKSASDQIDANKSMSVESTMQRENVVLRMPHQLQEALRKTTQAPSAPQEKQQSTSRKVNSKAGKADEKNNILNPEEAKSSPKIATEDDENTKGLQQPIIVQ